MKRISIAFGVLLIVTLTSIGYSAFGTELSISNIAASIRMENDIRVSNITISEVGNEVVSNYEEYNNTSINTSVSLPYEDSYIIYNVNVTNYGNDIMGIKSIINNNPNLKYELLNYEIGEEICDSLNKCILGVTKTIEIKVSYNNYDSNNLTQLLKLDFLFASYHIVTYKSITNNGYPISVMEDTNLVVNFTETLENLNISIGGVKLELNTDYTYIDNVLTIFNVSGNVEISNSDVDIIANRYITMDDNITFNGITVTSLGNGTYNINGSLNSSANTYIRLTDYFEAATSWTTFNSQGQEEIMIPYTTTFNYKISSISGSYTGITSSNQFKITFRESNLTNISTIGYDFYSGYISPNTTSVDIGMLVIFLSGGSKTFNNYTFKIEVKKEIIDNIETEPEPRDLTNCTVVQKNELTVSRCSDGLIDLTSSAPITGKYYILANESYLIISTSGTELYKANFPKTPKYLAGDNVYIIYRYYRGIPSFSKIESINFVIRDVTSTMSANESPKAVNTLTGDTYKQDFELLGTVDNDSIGVSIFLNNKITLDHYQFYLSDRKA